VADIVRGIGADFRAYGDAIEEQQIDGGMLYSLTHGDFNDLLVRNRKLLYVLLGQSDCWNMSEALRCFS
jgi:hypothetical protein